MSSEWIFVSFFRSASTQWVYNSKKIDGHPKVMIIHSDEYSLCYSSSVTERMINFNLGDFLQVILLDLVVKFRCTVLGIDGNGVLFSSHSQHPH